MTHAVRPAPSLRVVDSITELRVADAGCIAVSGSHGGLSAAHYAIAARPLLSVFNDAGIGKDAAGIAALALLQSHGLAAAIVSHDSARIGECTQHFARWHRAPRERSRASVRHRRGYAVCAGRGAFTALETATPAARLALVAWSGTGVTS